MKKRLKKAVLEFRNVVNLINDSLDTVERLNVEIDIQQEELRRLRGEVYEEEKIKQDIRSFEARLKRLEEITECVGYDKFQEESLLLRERIRQLKGEIDGLLRTQHTHFWK